MFGTVFILHLLQEGLLVLGSKGCLVLRIDIQSLVPLPDWSQRPERIEDMCWHAKNTCWCSHFSIIFGQLMLSQHHGEEQVFLPLSLLLGKSSHNAIHMNEHCIIDCDNMMRCDCMSLPHPQGPISEWSQFFHDILDNGPFILCCEEWRVIMVFWISEPLVGEFRWMIGPLKQL